MDAAAALALAFFFSFIGSIPPGTLNLTALQLGLENKIGVAWRFALAAALVEYPYAWLAVKFEKWITSSPVVLDNIQLVTAVVTTCLGAFTLLTAKRPGTIAQRFSSSGFRRGVVLSVLNPLALPYWIGITAYLAGQRWIELSDPMALHAYLVGVSTGALALLMLLVYLARRVAHYFKHSVFLKQLPGWILLCLGLYAFLQYIL